jgi:hypothetical protein
MKKIIQKPGDVFQIRIDSFFAYGRVLDYNGYAFYDLKTVDEINDVDFIITNPIIFAALVDVFEVQKKRWKIVGFAELEPKFKSWPKFYLPDFVNPTNYRIYDKGDIRQVTKEECINAEVGGVSNGPLIEERLKDYFEGRINKHVEIIKKLLH